MSIITLTKHAQYIEGGARPDGGAGAPGYVQDDELFSLTPVELVEAVKQVVESRLRLFNEKRRAA